MEGGGGAVPTEAQVLEERVTCLGKELDTCITDNKIDHEKFWRAIEGIRDRLPAWVTLVISILTFALGLVASLAFR